MPFFGRWPAALRTSYLRLVPRHKSADYWHRLVWRSVADWRALFGDPRLNVTRHWYGPLLLYHVIHGRRQPPSAAY